MCGFWCGNGTNGLLLCRKSFQQQTRRKDLCFCDRFISVFYNLVFPINERWIIIVLLVLGMTMVMQLQKKFNYAALLLLIFSMGGIISLRFYIFYMAAAAVVGSFVIGLNSSPQSIIRRSAILIILGLSSHLSWGYPKRKCYLRAFRQINRIQTSRQDLADQRNLAMRRMSMFQQQPEPLAPFRSDSLI